MAGFAAFALPLATGAPYLLQTLTNAWLAAMLALSLTLMAGTAGQISFGHAGLLAIGAYASALLPVDLDAPKVESSVTAPAKEEETGLAPIEAPKVESADTAPAKDEEAGAELNFRVSAKFRREFKIYAASHDLKLNKLLILSFHNYRKQQGD